MVIQAVASSPVPVTPAASAVSSRTQDASPPVPASQVPDSVTISPQARKAAAQSQPTPPVLRGNATPVAQTSASGYVAKVRAALSSNPNLTSAQAMTAAGVPQAMQQQVAAALGAAH